MKCMNCGTEMLVDDEYERGRHLRRKWKCPKCKNIEVRNIGTLVPRKW